MKRPNAIQRTRPRAVSLAVVACLVLAPGCRGRLPGPSDDCAMLGEAQGGGPPADCDDEAPTDAGPPVDGGSVTIPDAPRPINVILFIGDGMGAEQIKAARYFENGDTAPLLFEAFEHHGWQRTRNAEGEVTDSAAAATAMATGHKVSNRVLSLALPGDGAELATALELSQARGKSVGLVTIDTPLTDATPAAFGAHASSRYDDAIIAAGYLTLSRPDVLIGGPSAAMTAAAAEAAGYQAASTAEELRALDTDAALPICGLFESMVPTLAERTEVALRRLANDADGFFLLIEHEGSDNGGHTNDLARVIEAVLALEAAVAVAMDFAGARADTLLLVTSDHETGGLVITEADPIAGVLPAHSYTTTAHTAVDVPVFATGPGAEAIEGTFENTELFRVLTATR